MSKWEYWSQILITFLCFLFFSPATNAIARDVQIHFINVGYGDAILIEASNGQNILLDAGDAEHGEHLLAYLKQENVKTIEWAIITHPHQNHFEGFSFLWDTVKIKFLGINGDERVEEGYVELLTDFQDRNIPVDVLTKNRRIVVEDLIFDILHPELLNDGVNDSSLAMLLTYKDIKILLMGDVELEGQVKILKEFPELQNVDYIKVPHHGGPLAESFFESFNNKTFFISTGESQWGWPRDEDMNRLKGNVWRTDQHGTIVLNLTRKTVTKSPCDRATGEFCVEGNF